MLTRFVNERDPEQTDRRGAEVHEAATRDWNYEGDNFETRDYQKEISCALPPVFVLLHRLAGPGDSFDRPVGIRSRLHRGDRRACGHDEEGRRGVAGPAPFPE